MKYSKWITGCILVLTFGLFNDVQKELSHKLTPLISQSDRMFDYTLAWLQDEKSNTCPEVPKGIFPVVRMHLPMELKDFEFIRILTPPLPPCLQCTLKVVESSPELPVSGSKA